tara:strand:- start:21211 stop:21471 length:261 start_codon:yes stop_codon:yes gene_type:complete
MKAVDLNQWLFEIPLSDIQEDSFEEGKHEIECICCGKNIKNQNYSVHLLTNGNLVSSEENFDNSQGFFPIGNSCKNKLPNNFYWKS